LASRGIVFAGRPTPLAGGRLCLPAEELLWNAALPLPLECRDKENTMALKAKQVKKAAAKLVGKAADAAEPVIKAAKKAVKKQAKRIAKAAEPKIKDAKKAARNAAKGALMAGSKKLKKAAKAI
jgi:hypothetical protein